MAIGFSPKHILVITTEGFTNEQFIAIAVESARKLNWNISYISERGLIAYTKFSMSSYSEEVKLKIDNGIVTIKSECTGTQIFDWGKNKRNVERFLGNFYSMKNNLAPEELAKMVEETSHLIASTGEDILSRPPTTASENLGNFFSIFKPVKNFFITPIIVDLNILIFMLMVLSGVSFLSPGSDSLIKWGANFRPQTLNGEWWRIITSCFLHIGFIHLIFNMYALVYIGILLEPYLGKIRFAFAYILTGIASSMSSLWWHDLTVSAGASGAIFGMYGVFLAMLTTNLMERSARKALLISIGIFVGYNLLNGMKGGVDNAAHVGGLFSGLLIGYAYVPGLKKPAALNLQYGAVALTSVLIVGASIFFYKSFPRDLGKYYKKMEAFSEYETKALKVYTLPDDAPKNELSENLKSGLFYWQQNIKVLKEAEKLNITTEFHKRNQILLHYCNLRIKSYELMRKEVTEDTNRYDAEIKQYTDEIETLIENLEHKKD